MEAFDQLVRTETRVWNSIESRLQAAGLPHLGTMQALRALQRHGNNARIEEVRKGLSITNGAASKLVDRMEQAGLVARIPNPADRRSSLVTLSDLGQSTLTAGEEIMQSTLDQLIPLQESAALCDLLRTIDERLAKIEDQ